MQVSGAWRMCKDHALKGKTLVCRETGKMNRWSNEAANAWYEELPFLIGYLCPRMRPTN